MNFEKELLTLSKRDSSADGGKSPVKLKRREFSF